MMTSKPWFAYLAARRLWTVPALASVVLFVIAQYDFLTFHMAAEWFAIIISIIIFSLAWNTHDLSRNHFLIFLACGYLWIGVMDVGHTMVYAGMNIIVEGNGNLSSQFWIATRYLESLVLVLAPVCIRYAIKPYQLLSIFGLIAIVFTVLIGFGIFPTTYIEGSGLTPFKVYSEYIIIALLGTALVVLHKYGKAISDEEKVLITASIILTMLAELAFTFYISVYGLSNLAGHLFKIFSYWMIFQAVVHVNLRKPYLEQWKLSRAMDQSPSSVIITNRNHQIEYVNPVFLKKIAYSTDELLVMSPYDLMIEASRGELMGMEQRVTASLNNGDTWRGFAHFKTKGGGTFWEKATISPIRDESGNVTHFVAAGEDITQHREMNDIINDPENALQNTLLGSVSAIASLLEARDPYTAGHSSRVATLSVLIAREIGLPEDLIEALRLAALIHDIGKVKVPMEILNKPGRLSTQEFEIIKEHPRIGYETIKRIPFPWDIPQIVLCHHEAWDGSGYPNGLSGNDIPLEAQVLSVADLIEAVTAHRPYRAALGLDRAIEILKDLSGTKYNPQIADAAIRLHEAGELTLEDEF